MLMDKRGSYKLSVVAGSSDDEVGQRSPSIAIVSGTCTIANVHMSHKTDRCLLIHRY